MTDDEYSEKHLRMRCLEIARPMFPATADIEAMIRAADKLWTFVNARNVEGSDESGSRSESSSAPSVFKMTDEQYLRIGVDPDELKRMSES